MIPLPSGRISSACVLPPNFTESTKAVISVDAHNHLDDSDRFVTRRFLNRLGDADAVDVGGLSSK